MGVFDDKSSGVLGRSAFGLNDTTHDALYYQKLELAAREKKVHEAMARGLISVEQAENVINPSMGNASWIQDALFNGLPKLLGADEEQTIPNKPYHGGFLESLGDALSVGTYFSAALANTATESAKSDVGSSAALQVAAGLTGGVLGFAGGGPVGAVLGAGVGVGAGTVAHPSFSPDVFWKSWRNRTEYIDYLGDHDIMDPGSLGTFGTGLVLDIALDPISYLTFGVSSGAKVATTSAIRSGAAASTKSLGKLAKIESTELHLTRFGQRVYRLAAQEMQKVFSKELSETGFHLLDKAVPIQWHQRIAEHMVSNFDELSKAAFGRHRSKLWRGIAPAAQSNRDLLMKAEKSWASYRVDDLFQESAHFANREIGINFGKGARVLGGQVVTKTQQALADAANAKLGIDYHKLMAPIHDGFTTVFDKFSIGWRSRPEHVEFLRVAKQAITDEVNGAQRTIAKALSHFSAEERRVISRAVESEYAFDAALDLGTEAPPLLGAHVGRLPELQAGVKFVREQMKAILDAEHAAGFDTQTVRNYLTRLYDVNPRIKSVIEQTIRNNGEEHWYTANKYTQQRLIATISEGREVFGAENLIDDAYEVLLHRKKASVEMIQKTKVMEYLAKHEGIPALLIRSQLDGVSKGLIRGMMRRVGYGVHKILSIDQIYTEQFGNFARLGFLEETVENEVKVGGWEHNKRVWDWLRRPVTTEAGGRLSDDGEAIARTLGLPEAAKWHLVDRGARSARVPGSTAQSIPTSTVPGTLKWQPLPLSKVRQELSGQLTKVWTRRPRIEMPIEKVFKMIDDHTDEMWFEVMRRTAGGTELDMRRLAGFIGHLQRYTVKHFEAPLTAIVPDLEHRLMRVLKHHGEGRTIRGLPKEQAADMRQFAKMLQEGEADGDLHNRGLDHASSMISGYIKTLSTPLEIRKIVPQVPQVMVDLARRSQAAAGVITDMTPVTKWQRRQLVQDLAKLGFDLDTYKQLVKATFNKPEITTAAEADILLEMARPLVTDSAASRALGLSKKADEIVGGKMVLRRLTLSRKVEENPLREVFDQDLALPVDEIGSGLPGVSAAGREIRSIEERALKAGKPPPETMRIYDTLDTLTTQVSQSTRAQARLHSVKKAHSEAEEAVQKIKVEAKEYAEKIKDSWADLRSRRERMTSMRFLRGNSTIIWDLLSSGGTKHSASRLERYNKAAKQTKRSKGKDLLTEFIRHGERVFGDDWTMVMNTMFHVQKEGDKPASSATVQRFNKWVAGLLKQEKIRFHKSKGVSTLKTYQRKTRAYNDKLAQAMKKADDIYAQVTDLTDELQHKLGFDAEAGGGLTGGRRKIVDPPTPADDFKRARDKLAALERTGAPDYDMLIAYREVEAARAKLIKSARPDATPEDLGKYAGKYRPDTGELTLDLVLPDDVAALLDDFMAPDVPTKLSGFMRQAVMAFDKVQSFFKSSYLLPWAATWTRNGVSNTALATMGGALSVLSPRNGFKSGKDYLAILRYGLGRWSDMFNPGEAGLEALGRRVIRSDDGREITVAEMMEHAHMHGVLRGHLTTEALDNPGIGRRVTGTIQGGFMGGLLGAAAAAPAVNATGDREYMDYSSMLGAVAGAVLGGRRMARRGAGIPVPNRDRVTGTLQSNWAPLARIGEAATELPMRLALYISEFKKTGSLRAAQVKVFDYLNDWGGLSAFERRFVRRGVPFYNWSQFAVKNTAHLAVNDPKALSIPFKAFDNWNQQENVDPADVPDYYNEKLNMVVNTKDGGYRVLTGIGMPVEDVASMVTGINFFDGSADTDQHKEFTYGVLSRGPFGVMSALEFAFNRDTFSGSAISSPIETTKFEQGRYWDTAPSWVQTLVGYTPAQDGFKSSVSPHIAWTVGETPVSRVVNTMQKLYDMSPEGRAELDMYSLASALIGLNSTRVDPATGKVYVNRGRLRAMEALLKQVGGGAIYPDFAETKTGEQKQKGPRGKGPF